MWRAVSATGHLESGKRTYNSSRNTRKIQETLSICHQDSIITITQKSTDDADCIDLEYYRKQMLGRDGWRIHNRKDSPTSILRWLVVAVMVCSLLVSSQQFRSICMATGELEIKHDWILVEAISGTLQLILGSNRPAFAAQVSLPAGIPLQPTECTDDNR